MVESFASNLPLLMAGAGLVLAIAETFIPGSHFFVMGAALFLAGIVGVVFPPVANIFVLTGLTVIFAGITLYAYRRAGIVSGDGGRQQTSNSDSLKGTLGHATEPITPTNGEVKIADGGFNPYYQARTMNGTIDEGDEVVVLDPGGGNVLTVESTSPQTDAIDRELQQEKEVETETETVSRER